MKNTLTALIAFVTIATPVTANDYLNQLQNLTPVNQQRTSAQPAKVETTEDNYEKLAALQDKVMMKQYEGLSILSRADYALATRRGHSCNIARKMVGQFRTQLSKSIYDMNYNQLRAYNKKITRNAKKVSAILVNCANNG